MDFDFQYFIELFFGGLTRGSIYALIALGYTLVYGIIGLLNFAHGEIYMIGAFTALLFSGVLGYIGFPAGGILLVAALGSIIWTSAYGYTLEKVSHADVTAGEIDGFVDYYQYTDPAGKICTGVIEHMYKEGADTPTADTAAELAKLESRLKAKYPTASPEQIARMMEEIAQSLTGDACQSYAFSALGYKDWVYIGTMYGGTGITKNDAPVPWPAEGREERRRHAQSGGRGVQPEDG